jgi:cell division protein FtsB
LRYSAITMSAIETAKEIGRIAATATLGKDVIDLLKEKVALLAEQVTTLEQEKVILNTQNADLKKKVVDLQQQLSGITPDTDAIEPDAVKFLQVLFRLGQNPSIDQLAAALGIAKGMAEYHRDSLTNLQMIRRFQTMPTTYGLLPKGREYVVKKVLPPTAS